MGLAFPAIAITGSIPFWQALGSQLSAAEMAFYLARIKDDTNAKDEEPGGVFTLGGTSSTLFTGDIEHCYAFGYTNLLASHGVWSVS